MINIKVSLTGKDAGLLKAGDEVLLSGIIYTARDQAHKRLAEAIKKGAKLPFDLKGQIIYYCGPTGTPKGKVIGSCGPTTSSRMDAFTPFLLKKGLRGMIGKGRRSQEVIAAIKKYRSVYFLAPAGCGALLAKCVKRSSVVAYRDLGPEAILKLEVKDFPLIVAIDYLGNNIYKGAST
jgi:fumarate hydratase subunit beta